MNEGFERVGLIRSRPNCCLFTWRDKGMSGARKTIEVGDDHCESCVQELRRMAPALRLVDRRRARAVDVEDGPRRVLVVDDDPDIRAELAVALAERGWEVACAEDGLQALDYLRSGAVLPRVILLDLMMPVMDGNQFRQHQVGDPALSAIPVVVVTAGRDRPAPDLPVVTKPLRLDAITRVMEAQLRH